MNDAELAYAAWFAEEEETRQENIVLARDYYDGEHEVPLTKRQKEYLGFQDDGRFCLNYCRMVVDAVMERLLLQAFTSADEDWAGTAWDWWQTNDMDEIQHVVHLGAIRDGEYFIIVDWDEEKREPRFIPHARYTSARVDGTGFGCKAFYPNGDDTRRMTKASKRWVEVGENDQGERETRQRMTVYYPDHIEKYQLATKGSEAGWQEIELVPWVDGGGQALGIPIIHFRNPALRTEIWDAIPVQDAINKTAADILAAADTAGFRIFFTRGFYPTTDGKAPDEDGDNYLEIFPGCMIGHSNTETALDVVDPTDLSSLLAGLDSLVVKLAQITDTPTSRLQLTGQVASEGTLKQQEGPLLSKVRLRQIIFGNSWENMMSTARRLANHFGGREVVPAEGEVQTEWKPAATRDEKEFREGLKLESELGVPMEMLWQRLGYDQEQVDRMKAMRGEELQQQSNVGGELLRAFETGVQTEGGG